MTQSRRKIVHRLRAAQREQLPVAVRRKHLAEDEDLGYVVAVLDDWVVIQDLGDVAHLDAVVLLRLDYVTSVTSHRDEAYVTRVVGGVGKPIAEFDAEPDATVGDLLRLVNESADLVCVRLESDKDYWYVIGKILRIGKKWLDVHYIGRDGVWASFVERWKLKDITRIEFGGRYITTLEQFGDPMPTLKLPRVKRK